MTRLQALEWIVAIANTYEGSHIWDELRDEELFQCGMEYGIVIALTKAYDFTKDDLEECEECCE